MLIYFKKYIFAAYALAFAVPIILMVTWSVIAGENVVKTTPGLFTSLALFGVCLLGMMSAMGRRADKKAEQLVSLYNDACDPPAFVAQAETVARNAKAPYNESGSWFMSFYTLALADVGRLDEAARIGDAMRLSAADAKTPQSKAAMLINIEPVIKRLFGPEMALAAVQEAEHLLEVPVGTPQDDRLKFLSWEHDILNAMITHDKATLCEKYLHVRTTPGYPLRMRVLAAFDEAVLHRECSEISQETECLLFVVEHGGALPAVKAANTRLEELRA